MLVFIKFFSMVVAFVDRNVLSREFFLSYYFLFKIFPYSSTWEVPKKKTLALLSGAKIQYAI